MSSRLLLISTSTVHGSGYLEYCSDDIRSFLHQGNPVLFVPYARPGGMSHDAYTSKAKERFATMGLELTGIHEDSDPVAAVRSAAALFVGGGNTFLLLRELYAARLVEEIRATARSGTPYIGTSAGSNIAGLTIGTTNDMPIVYPPALDALSLVPFNINPHYIDPDPDSRHMGETRETRIREFHAFNAQPVVGLREGAMLHVTDAAVTVRGSSGARLFRAHEEPAEYLPGADLSFLLS